MVDSFIRFLIQLVIVLAVAFVVWYVGNLIIAELHVSAIVSKVWLILIALLALLGILRAARPFLS